MRTWRKDSPCWTSSTALWMMHLLEVRRLPLQDLPANLLDSLPHPPSTPTTAPKLALARALEPEPTLALVRTLGSQRCPTIRPPPSLLRQPIRRAHPSQALAHRAMRTRHPPRIITTACSVTHIRHLTLAIKVARTSSSLLRRMLILRILALPRWLTIPLALHPRPQARAHMILSRTLILISSRSPPSLQLERTRPLRLQTRACLDIFSVMAVTALLPLEVRLRALLSTVLQTAVLPRLATQTQAQLLDKIRPVRTPPLRTTPVRTRMMVCSQIYSSQPLHRQYPLPMPHRHLTHPRREMDLPKAMVRPLATTPLLGKTPLPEMVPLVEPPRHRHTPRPQLLHLCQLRLAVLATAMEDRS